MKMYPQLFGFAVLNVIEFVPFVSLDFACIFSLFGHDGMVGKCNVCLAISVKLFPNTRLVK
jgi:hypothetical protein